MRPIICIVLFIGFLVFFGRMRSQDGADTPENWFNLFAWMACLCAIPFVGLLGSEGKGE